MFKNKVHMIKENIISYSIFDIEVNALSGMVRINDVYFEFPDRQPFIEFLATGIDKVLLRSFKESKANMCIAKFATHQFAWSNKLQYGSKFPPELMITHLMLKTRMDFETEQMKALVEQL